MDISPTRPILSVCIPTYHRRAQILRQLSHIGKSGKATLAHVEVLVSDNSINPEQFLTADDLAEIPYPLRYWVNSRNFGYAGNLEKLIHEATGTYVWLLSDDDPVYPEALAKILQTLEDYPQTNYLTFDHDVAVDGNIVTRNRWFRAEDAGFYEEGNSFLARHLASTCFVSINLFRRDLLLKLADDLQSKGIRNRTHQNMLWATTFIVRYGGSYCLPQSLFCESSGEKVWSYETSMQGPVDCFQLYAQMQAMLPDTSVLKDFAGGLFHMMSLSTKQMTFESAYIRPDFDFTDLFRQLLAVPFKNWKLRVHLRLLQAGYGFFRKKPKLLKRIYFNLGRARGWTDAYEWASRLESERRKGGYVSTY